VTNTATKSRLSDTSSARSGSDQAIYAQTRRGVDAGLSTRVAAVVAMLTPSISGHKGVKLSISGREPEPQP